MSKGVGPGLEPAPSKERSEADQKAILRARRERSIRRLAVIAGAVALFIGLMSVLDGFQDFEWEAILLGLAATLFWVGAEKAHETDHHLRYYLAGAASFLAILAAAAIVLIDPATSKPSRPHKPAEVTQVPVAGQPRAIAAQGRYVWVVGNDDKGGVLSRIDTWDLESPAETMEGFKAEEPFDIAIGPKAVWVTDGGSLIKLDLQGREVWRESLGNEQAYNEVDVGLGRVWFKQTWPGKLVVLRPDPVRKIKTIPLSKSSSLEATALAVGFESVWVSNANGESSVVFRFDREGDQMGTIEVPNSPQDMAAGERLLLVAHGQGSLVTRVDPRPDPGRAMAGDIKLWGNPPGGIATGAGAVWIPFEGGEEVFALSQCSWKRLGHAETGEDPLDVVVLDGKAYVPNQKSGNVSVFELKTPLPKEEKTCSLGP